jgi:hypothetical protein
MTAPRVWTFFYGSYMNPEVLAQLEIELEAAEVAQLDGFELVIAPLANLVRTEAHTAFGVVGRLPHAQLDELYAHARDALGGLYLPEAVLVRARSGRYLPALCWISPQLEPGPIDADYVDRIATPAREFGFPRWYVEHIESFKRTRA